MSLSKQDGTPDGKLPGGLTRRGFLRLGTGALATPWIASAHAAGSGEVHFPPIQAPTEKPEKTEQFDPPGERVGFAVVGLGRIAVNEMLPAFARSKHARVTSLVSGDRDKALKIARQYGIPEQAVFDYRDHDRLADHKATQAVYIALPNSMHAEYTVRAAQAGKHVFCEKPMANSVAECQQMIDACAKAQRLLMIAYRSQYEANDRAILKMVRARRLGTLREFISSNCQNQGDPDQWRHKKALAGGGPLPDVGIYCLNAARFLSGEEPVEVIGHTWANPNDPRFREIEEAVHFILRFPSGFTATCTSSYSGHNAKFLRLIGSEAWVELDPAYSYSGIRLRVGRLVDGKDSVQEIALESDDQFVKELDHMAQCVKANRRPHTPGEEGLQDMRVIEAIYQSAREGRPVTLAPPAFSVRGPVPEDSD
ncbi:Gfo/Idh/MocA family protein [Noviherbaspirillum galbum]|uniref:Gfo/Idh/MocA family oxidoreductase n=1 Tax=Noviherbaspirillum galbum TaxID=2709383 RepID=A0A6B3SS07_9BURK|nr:Gfo/Idh/MocA family oxidoreductase [Noviherbaspirillum galbum]NEX62125.1 Gfo/Idh/MocA family oxidoreductase [Noviherbaspirillum galbum]